MKLWHTSCPLIKHRVPIRTGPKHLSNAFVQAYKQCERLWGISAQASSRRLVCPGGLGPHPGCRLLPC